MASKDKANDDLREGYFSEKRMQFEDGCEQGSGTACFSLAEWYQLVAKDTLKAASLYDDNCFKRKHANSCFNLAMLYLASGFNKPAVADKLPKLPDGTAKLPPSSDKELDKMTDTLERGCALQKRACVLGNGQGCASAGQLMISGIGCEKDVGGAMERYKLACDRDDPGACFRLGALFIKGERHNIPRDPKKAFGLMEKGCALGHPNACQVLAVMYRKGDGVEKNEAKFEKYKKLTLDIVKKTGEQMGAKVVN